MPSCKRCVDCAMPTEAKETTTDRERIQRMMVPLGKALAGHASDGLFYPSLARPANEIADPFTRGAQIPCRLAHRDRPAGTEVRRRRHGERRARVGHPDPRARQAGGSEYRGRHQPGVRGVRLEPDPCVRRPAWDPASVLLMQADFALTTARRGIRARRARLA